MTEPTPDNADANTQVATPNWYPDPTGRFEYRFYNGQQWTADVSVNGHRSVDPFGTAMPVAGTIPGVSVPPEVSGTLATVAFGSEFAIGKNPLTDPSWFHMGAGYAVFAIALGGMIAIAWLLTNLGTLWTNAGSLIQTLKQETQKPVLISTDPSPAPSEHDEITALSKIHHPSSKISRRPESPY